MKKLDLDQMKGFVRGCCQCKTCLEIKGLVIKDKGCPCNKKTKEGCVGCLVKRLRKIYKRSEDDCRLDAHHVAGGVIDILELYNTDVLEDWEDVEVLLMDIYSDIEERLEYCDDEEPFYYPEDAD